MINGVIFDFNGTLLDDWKFHVQAWKKLAKDKFNKELTEETLLYKLNGLPNEEIINYLSDNKLSKEENLALSKEKEKYYRDTIAMTDPRLIDGAENLFQYLKDNHIPFTIASASIKENIDFFIETFNLNQYFDPSLIVYDDGTFSHKSKMYAKAIRDLKLNPVNTLIFEDSLSGIKGALQNNTKVIAIKNQTLLNEYNKLNLVKVIDNYRDLLNDKQLITALFK